MYKLIKEALPFIANLFFTTVYARSAILVISYIMGDQATGLFEIALAFTIKGVVVSQIISKSLFPSLSNLFNVSPIDYDILSQKLIKIISIIAIVLCSIIFLYCPYIITFIISDDLSLSAIYLIRIMVVALYFKLLVIPIGDVLTTSNRQECRTKSVAIGALINIIGLFTLIPILGLTGAAITMLITEFVIFSCNFYFSIRNLKTYIIKFIFLGILNIGVAILVINLINITSLYSILLLCIIYLSMTLITNTITINEIKSLWFKILKV